MNDTDGFTQILPLWGYQMELRISEKGVLPRSTGGNQKNPKELCDWKQIKSIEAEG